MNNNYMYDYSIYTYKLDALVRSIVKHIAILTPTDTGRLLASLYIRSENTNVVRIGFDTSLCPYALYVHELPYKHKNGQTSKFLEIAVFNAYRELGERDIPFKFNIGDGPNPILEVELNSLDGNLSTFIGKGTGREAEDAYTTFEANLAEFMSKHYINVYNIIKYVNDYENLYNLRETNKLAVYSNIVLQEKSTTNASYNSLVNKYFNQSGDSMIDTARKNLTTNGIDARQLYLFVVADMINIKLPNLTRIGRRRFR